MKDTRIINCSLEDIEQLQKIGRQTFLETFSSNNSKENMKMYLEDAFSTEQLKAELSNENSEFYFAVLGEDIIGYLKINTGDSQTEIKDKKSLEIERIYVLKKYHGKRVGQLLFEKAIEISREKAVDFIWLGVWEKNPRALRFYEKNGFVKFDKHIFILGDDEQTDIMMKLQMKK